ncbi:MAG TPA: hypothetical protein VMC85_05900 [Desulfomonilaceae bacterium]|nr:hypothetical protein [Desulfomonilaceae bacterium]
MSLDSTKLEEAGLIRARYNEAIKAAYLLYCDTEEVAAYAVLEIARLQHLSPSSEKEEQELQERLAEKQEVLSTTKENLNFILDKIQELARERAKYISDIYMSRRIVDLEEKLTDLTPWIEELSTEIEDRANAAKLNAKISSEIARAVKY